MPNTQQEQQQHMKTSFHCKSKSREKIKVSASSNGLPLFVYRENLLKQEDLRHLSIYTEHSTKRNMKELKLIMEYKTNVRWRLPHFSFWVLPFKPPHFEGNLIKQWVSQPSECRDMRTDFHHNNRLEKGNGNSGNSSADQIKVNICDRQPCLFGGCLF